MRSELDKSFAGAGTYWSFYENLDKEIYRNHRTHVRLPYDYLSKEERQALNGPVITYHISELEGSK